MEPFTTGLTVALVLFMALAAVVTVAAVAILGESLVRNHRIRVARHETIRTYYRGLALTH
jgi:hypothetical protein